MFPLGHLGIGRQLIPPKLRQKLSWHWLALGCLLPDLIDKPLWLAQRDGLLGAQLSFLQGTRMIGHTLLLILALALAARLFRFGAVAAVALGALTHALLDLAGGLASTPRTDWKVWLLWPAYGVQFEAPGNESLLRHLLNEEAIYLAGEALGAALLIAQLVQSIRARRQ